MILYFFENDVSANNMTERGSVDQLRGSSLFINGNIGITEQNYILLLASKIIIYLFFFLKFE